MSLETARAILEGMADVAPEPWRTHFARALEELETPEERRKRRERDKKRAQRANGSRETDPPDKPPDDGPVPVLSPSASPVVSPIVPDESVAPSRALPSLSSSSSPLLLTAQEASQTAKRARGGARKGPRTPMPDPERDPDAFAVFVTRWGIPVPGPVPHSVPCRSPEEREAEKFVAKALAHGWQYIRWDWAWRTWLSNVPEAASGVHPVAAERRAAPEPPPPFTPQPAVRAAVQAHLAELDATPMPNGGTRAR
jgi:hypothetical protein